MVTTKNTLNLDNLDPLALNRGLRRENSPTSSGSHIGSRVDMLLGTRSPRSTSEVTSYQEQSDRATDVLSVLWCAIILMFMVMSIAVLIYALATIGL